MQAVSSRSTKTDRVVDLEEAVRQPLRQTECGPRTEPRASARAFSKWLGFALAAFCSVAARGNVATQASSADLTRTLVIWHTLEPAQSQILHRLVQQALASTGFDFRLETGFSLAQALLKLAPRSRYPDVILTPSDLLNLAPKIPFQKLDDSWFEPGTERIARTDQTQTGVPLFLGNHLMLFYNRSLVKSPVKSWQELMAEVESFEKNSIIPIVWDYRESYFLLPFYAGFLKKASFDPGRPEASLAESPHVPSALGLHVKAMGQALSAYKTLLLRRVVSENCGFQCVNTFFSEGKAAYALLGDWSVLNHYAALGDDLGLAPLPAWGELRLPALQMPIVLAFPQSERTSSQERTAALKKLSRFLQSEASLELWSREGLRLVASRKVREMSLIRNPPVFSAVAQLYLDAEPLPAAIDSLTWSAMNRALQLHTEGTFQADEAAEKLFELIKSGYLDSQL